ncbi:PfkB family carbohydrate kinase [Actinoplanes sp. NPDC026619]|uniref:PfkB family carbohydrate kinase n=1 Tax=Actinoplanes sp. NPDC026619 TaxID=3155798 RepID=UPI0033FF9A73
MSTDRIVVVGQLARDIVLQVDGIPEAGTAGDVSGRREMLGGKGANQAVAVAQLGVPVSLVAVVGDDFVCDQLLARAISDGIDVRPVVRRRGAPTGLIVEVLEADGQWRYLQHLPESVLLTPTDVDGAANLLRDAGAVTIQLQQPADAVKTAIRLAREGDALVVADGFADAGIIARADVVRADEHEAGMLGDIDKVLDSGPELVAFATTDGNLFAWRGPRWGEGRLELPLTGGPVVDTTGAGDSFTAALTVALLRGDSPADAARKAVDAAGDTVRRPGGRPDLGRDDRSA